MIGRVELTAQQTALIRLLLKDELEPETERNLYAGRHTEELAERALVLAVSVLGLVRVAAQLRELGRAGMLDLGLDWEPPKDEIPTVIEHDEKTPLVETLDAPAPQPVVFKAPSAIPGISSEVESLD